MDGRAKKRVESEEKYHAEKRACSSPGIRPASSSSSEPPEVPAESASSSSDHHTAELHMADSSSSVRSERGSLDGSSYSDGGDEDDEIDPYPYPGADQRQCYSYRGEGRYGYFPSTEKMESLLSSLDYDAGSSAHLAALTDLCEMLSFGSEESLVNLVADSFARSLVRLAGLESNPDIMLLAIRALTYLCDVLPMSAAAIVNHGALPVLCAHLTSIEYLDVAEQGIQALEKISRRQPVPCLRAGAIMACLAYIGFLTTSIQRVAVSTVANVCEKLPTDCSSFLMEAIPALCNLLHYDDSKIVETSVVCLNRISANFLDCPESLDDMCKHDLINHCVRLISSCCQPSVSQTMSIDLMRILTRLASGSLLAFKELFQLNISTMLKGILETTDNYHIMFHSLRGNRNDSQVHEVLKLLTQLLPYSRNKEKGLEFVLAKEKILAQEPNFLHQLVKDILPILIQVVNIGASPCVCYGCVSLIESMVFLSSLETLLDSIEGINFSGFLAALLKRRDNHVLSSSLKTVQILLERHYAAFVGLFIKEGVVYAVDALQMPENVTQFMPQAIQPCRAPRSESAGISIKKDSKCFCHVFDPRDSLSSQSGTCAVSEEAVLDLAKQIKSTYFKTVMANSETGLSDILQKLKISCSNLDDRVENNSKRDFCAQNEEYLARILMQVMEILNGEPLSTFEFIESRFMKSLANYLSNGVYFQAEVDDSDLENHFSVIFTRFRTFATICLLKSCQHWEGMLLKLLVRKLLSALATFDDFPIVSSLSYHHRYSYADIPCRGYTINPCLRVRFVSEDESVSKEYADNVLAVESSSSFDEIEGILWPRISGKQSGQLGESTGKGVGETGSKHSGGSKAHEDTYLAEECTEEMTPCQEHKKVIEFTVNQEFQHSVAEDASVTDEELVTCIRGSRSVSRVNGHDASPKLLFYLEGEQVDRRLTLFQTILQHQLDVESDVAVGPKFWSDVYRVTYKRIEHKQSVPKSSPTTGSKVTCERTLLSWPKHPFFSCILDGTLPCRLDKSKSSYDVLFLLKVLEGLNQVAHRISSYETIKAFANGRVSNTDDLKRTVSTVPRHEFLSSKLNEKLEEQMRDPLSASTGNIPPWYSRIMAVCPFLFSFETRWKYIRLTEFRAPRIQENLSRRWDSSIYSPNSGNNQRSHTGNVARKRFIVDRDCILDSASKIMSSQIYRDSILEVEYSGEVGTGLGPTLEFYTLVSREFQKVGLSMWRGDHSYVTTKEDSDSGHVVASLGLFPRPWSETRSSSNRISFNNVKNFALLGRIIAKALRDGRVLDLSFSKAFYKLMLQQELDVYDVQSFDPELGRTLLEFLAIVYRRKYIESASGKNAGTGSDLLYRGSRIEDLCLDFSLPGYSDYFFASGDNPEMVNIANLEEYVSLILDATIGSGISRQMEAFKSGFNEVFPLKALHIFSEDELERLLCGEQNSWTSDELLHHVKFDHGYSSSSQPVISLMEVIQEFSWDQRRAFLQFVTGAPRLPPGGLASLNPKLTVVRKHCNDSTDMELPSVMTCANYLKLPAYSSKELLRERLLYAITEGQGSFHLS
ncbi:unnamed protein product [Spirodela intermedia]|uniref:HECT-type E3 ubiquitin transferase n=1 Tax=Spirodela intermedia TaxID=51605 RepID=A0A7I8K1U0_SPIIN|nr:unnamed protein product [Spirodela intermedia]